MRVVWQSVAYLMMRRKQFSEKTHQLVFVSPKPWKLWGSSCLKSKKYNQRSTTILSHLSFTCYFNKNWTTIWNTNFLRQVLCVLRPQMLLGFLPSYWGKITYLSVPWWHLFKSNDTFDLLPLPRHLWITTHFTSGCCSAPRGRDTPAGDSDACALSFEKNFFSDCCLLLFVHLHFFFLLLVAKTLVLSSKTCDMECL